MWPADENTAELLDNARGGDEHAFTDLMDRHRAAIHRLVEMRLDRKIQRRVDASDIVQEVMIEANRRIRDYLSQSSPMPFHLWLRQITRDRIIDAHRRHRVSEKRSVDRERGLTAPANMDHSSMELAAQICDTELTPAAQATQRELAKRVEQMVGQLNDQDAEIIIMRHYEQLTNQEAAAALNLTEPAASMRYLRAVRRLRALLMEPPSSAQ
jgi:RNA polymerase sigma-70 factor (ECF subfamily)